MTPTRSDKTDSRSFIILVLVFTLVLSAARGHPIGERSSASEMRQKERSSVEQNSLSESFSSRQFEKGVKHYNAGRYYSALDIFRRLKNYPPAKNPQLTASTLMCMKSHFRIGRTENARETGREFLKSFPGSSYIDDVHECFGDIFLEKNRYTAAVRSYLEALTVSMDDSTALRLQQKIMKLSTSYLEKKEIEDVLAKELLPSNRAILYLMMANSLLASGETDAAALTLFRMDREVLSPGLQEFYDSLRSRTYRKEHKAVTVGVVVPLSGFDEGYGKAFLAGLRWGVETTRSRVPIDIVMELVDNEGDNLMTTEGIQALSANPNVVAIIGPLSNINAVTAATAVDGLQIPLLIPTATRAGLAMMSTNAYQLNPDLFKQGQYAAQYAVGTLGLRRVAVVAPADRFGKTLTDGFVQRSDDLGAEVVTVEWYSGIPLDLRDQLSSLRRVAFQLETLRQDSIHAPVELDSNDLTSIVKLEDFFPEEDQDAKELSPEDSSELILTSIDAVYLPIHTGDINYIASQFSSYYLDTQILGNGNWYEPEEFGQEMIGPNLEGMIVFSDYLHDTKWLTGQWSENIYSPLTSRAEHRMAMIGYETAAFLTSHLGANLTRASLLENLRKPQTVRGKARDFSFAEVSPRVNSSLNVLQYTSGEFSIVAQFLSDSLFVPTVRSP